MTEWIIGRNPVFEVLRAGRRRVVSLIVAEGAQVKGRLQEIVQLSQKAFLPVNFVPRKDLDRFGTNHQGIAVEVGEYPYATEFDIIAAEPEASSGLVLILDTIQDPQNLGTLIRTAESVGVRGVIIPLKRTALITPAVVQSSSGASEHILVAQANLAGAINRLKENEYWVIGMENSPNAQTPESVQLGGQIALVVGSEGYGMRRLVRDSCDLMLRLPIQGQVGSLNASVAGSIALYLVWAAQGYGRTA
jgi:23S rRNA (guanosine2251-2'-O)-methyltransferase